VKHAAVDFQFVRHYVDIKRVHVVHVHGADQIADTLTKVLPKSSFESNLLKLRLVTYRLT